MPQSERLKRMSRLTLLAGPAPDSEEGKLFEAWALRRSEDPTVKRKIKSLYREAIARISAQCQNGAGLPMDQLIRYFFSEYNKRNIKQGLHFMPLSFNTMEAFFEYDTLRPMFHIWEERDHLLSFVEFLDYVTSPGCSSDLSAAIEDIADDVIYSYNAINHPGAIRFSVNESEFGIGGISLIRHGDEVNVVLLAGERTDLNLKSEELRGCEVVFRQGIQPAEDRKREAVGLLGTTDFWQVIALTRFNLEDKTYDARHLLWDIGDGFIHFTDDLTAFLDFSGEFPTREDERVAREQVKRIERYPDLFGICKTALYLPSYFEVFGALVAEERHETRLGREKATLKSQQRNRLMTRRERVNYRRVSVLHRENATNADRTSYAPPEFHIDESGFWRTLPLDHVGADKHGQPIHGRTWVRKSVSWIDHRADNGSIDLKSDREPKIRSGPSREPGYIYVMRSAAHEKDIFKIGLTRRNSEMRSEELSRTTGAPDKFLVVQEWMVEDCRAAERLIHERLDAYRINPRREFFRVPYKKLVSVIQDIVAHL